MPSAHRAMVNTHPFLPSFNITPSGIYNSQISHHSFRLLHARQQSIMHYGHCNLLLLAHRAIVNLYPFSLSFNITYSGAYSSQISYHSFHSLYTRHRPIMHFRHYMHGSGQSFTLGIVCTLVVNHHLTLHHTPSGKEGLL